MLKVTMKRGEDAVYTSVYCTRTLNSATKSLLLVCQGHRDPSIGTERSAC